MCTFLFLGLCVFRGYEALADASYSGFTCRCFDALLILASVILFLFCFSLWQLATWVTAFLFIIGFLVCFCSARQDLLVRLRLCFVLHHRGHWLLFGWVSLFRQALGLHCKKEYWDVFGLFLACYLSVTLSEVGTSSSFVLRLLPVYIIG